MRPGCPRMHGGRGDFAFPDGENTAAHDTSLDRYPVWRIRSFIGIDMFAAAWSFTLVVYRTHFYPLDIIMRSERTFSRRAFKFNKFSIAKSILAKSTFYRKRWLARGTKVISQTRTYRTIARPNPHLEVHVNVK